MPDPVAPSAPAAPAPAPAAAPTPAPAPSPAPAAPAPAAPAPAPVNNDLPSIADAWKSAVDSVPLEDDPADAPAVDPAAPADADPAAPADADPDAPAVKDPTAPAPAAEDQPDPDLTLDLSIEDTDFGPKELGDFLKQDAAVDKFFNDHPDVKNRVFAMARRDQETRGIREIAPTLAIAQEMQRGHGLYETIDGHFLKADTPEGFKGFMDMWVEQAMIVDDKGQPIKGEDGKYQLHPALTSIIENIHGNRSDYLAGEMAKTGKIPPALAKTALKVLDVLSKSADERQQEAAQILKEALSPQSSAEGELPDELKPYSERLQAKEKALNDKEEAQARTQRESETTARTEALGRADQKAAQVCVTQVKPVLQKAGLTEYETKNALREIGELVDGKLKSIDTYQRTRDRLEAGTIDAAREKEISKTTLTYTQEILGPIVRDVIRRATAGKLGRQTATEERVAQQQRDSRTDPRGTSVSSSPAAPQSPEQIEAGLIKEYADAHNGDKPDRRWLTEKTWERMNAAPRRRTA